MDDCGRKTERFKSLKMATLQGRLLKSQWEDKGNLSSAHGNNSIIQWLKLLFFPLTQPQLIQNGNKQPFLDSYNRSVKTLRVGFHCRR